MKAAYINETGSPDKIMFGELAVPDLKSNQVLVRTTAVTVDPIDTYIRAGLYKIDMPSPFIIGRDMTGVVEEVGVNVISFKPGDRVWANNQGYAGRQGTFAELLAIDEHLLYKLPHGVEPAQAVASVHSALTAVVGLFSKANIQSGETIFINGGSGNVGTAVVQIAKFVGAKVAVSAGSPDKIAYCEEEGADLVIDYKRDDVVSKLRSFAPNGVNIYWDASPAPNIEAAVGAVSRRGRILLMSGLQARTELSVGQFYTRNCTMYGFTITDRTDQELAESAETINKYLANGVLKARIQETMPLSKAAEAHRLMEQKQLSGKIVLTP